jgi:hypothetical protein
VEEGRNEGEGYDGSPNPDGWLRVNEHVRPRCLHPAECNFVSNPLAYFVQLAVGTERFRHFSTPVACFLVGFKSWPEMPTQRIQ